MLLLQFFFSFRKTGNYEYSLYSYFLSAILQLHRNIKNLFKYSVPFARIKDIVIREFKAMSVK